MAAQQEEMQMRLAMRHEGDFWNAYIAQPGTMDGAILIGSIAFGLVAKDALMKDGFMALMMMAMEATIEKTTGTKPEAWHDPVAAPPHEREDHA